MDREQARNAVRQVSRATILAGIWLVVAPSLLGYTEVLRPSWNDLIVGVAVAVVGLSRLKDPLSYPELGWLTALLGGWLMLAPLALGYAVAADGSPAVMADGTMVALIVEAAAWNDMLVGALLLYIGASSIAACRVSATALAATSRPRSGAGSRAAPEP